jgi:hypothetical protein
MKKIIVGALLVLGLVAPVAPASAGVLDKLYEKLVQEYWIWAFNQPEATNPLVGNAPFCGVSKDGKFAMLSGYILGNEKQERSCTISRNQSLYLSVLSGIYIAFESDDPSTKTYEAMLDAAACPDATGTVKVDGIPLNVSWSHTKTGIFEFPVADGGLLRDWIGDEQTDGAVVEGIHVVLPPLFRGKHTVSWHAESVSCGFDSDGDGTPEPLVKDFVYKLDVR